MSHVATGLGMPALTSQLQTKSRGRNALAGILLVTLVGNIALLGAWGWTHPDEGIEAFLGVDGNKYRVVAENPLGRSMQFWDSPYRYQRVLVPAAWWLLSAGQRAVIPYVSVMLNVVAVCAGTVLVGVVCLRGGVPAWWALVYGFAPGLQRALTAGHLEPVANLLILLALVAWVQGHKRTLLVILALLPLVKEVYAVFLVAFFAGELLARRRPRWVWVAVLAPFVVWQAYIRWRFGAFGATFHLFDVQPRWGMLISAIQWNLVVERPGARLVVLAQAWSVGLVVAVVAVVVRRLAAAYRQQSVRFGFAELSLFAYTLLLIALMHKVAYQLEAFFRVASTALPMVFVAGLCPRPEGMWEGQPPVEQRDRTLVGLVLMFSALLSVLGIPILFLYLGSLPPLLFEGTPLHP